MQNIAYSRYFNFQNNTLPSHSHNIVAISCWFVEMYPPSHNNCLALLARAYGYKSYAALNSAIKSNKPLEPLQPKEVYLKRLEQADYSNYSDFGNSNPQFFKLIASYIVDCKLDLNRLNNPSPLKDLYLSSERTLVSTLFSTSLSFLDYAILNTIIAATYDHGLPSEIRIDKRIVDLYSGPKSGFYNRSNGYVVELDLFAPTLMVDSGPEHYIVQFSEETHLHFSLLTNNENHSSSYQTTNGLYENFNGANDYPKQLTNIRHGYFEPPKTLLKENLDTIRIFTRLSEPLTVLSVHKNSFQHNDEQILELLKNFILNIPVHKITDILLNLRLADDTIKLIKIQHNHFDFDVKRIRRKDYDCELSMYFSDSIEFDGSTYLAEMELNISLFIDYIIDCNDKPSIAVQSLQLIDNDDICSVLHLFKLTNGEVDQSDEMLRLSANFKAPKALPYVDKLKIMLNQYLNCHAFEIGCFYHVLKKHIESSPISLR